MVRVSPVKRDDGARFDFAQVLEPPGDSVLDAMMVMPSRNGAGRRP
jgi:hypothetical protein